MAKTIVCVDDDLDMRIFLAAVLRSSGYIPIPARNAVEGMEKVRESSPDLVIMDVMMPKAGGVTMFRELKSDERLKHIPVVMLTGVSEKAFSHHVRMVNLRIDDHLPPPDAYLEKPLNPDTLIAAIQRLLP
jgi:CheY-like chemotaxis protein